MKNLLILFCLNYSLSTFSNSIHLENGDKYFECKFAEKHSEMLCEEDGTIVYTKNDGWGEPYAIEYSKKSKEIKIRSIDKIATDKEEYFYYADPRYPSEIIYENDRYEGLISDIKLASSPILGNEDFYKNQSEFKNQLKEVLEEVKKKNDFLDNAKEENLQVEIDGKNEECVRDSSALCSFVTCKQKETGDTFYISINDSSYSSFLAYPAPGNKLRKYLPEINKLKTKSGEVLLATKMVEGEHILRGTVPSHYKNNPDLFNSSHSMNENSLKYATSNCKSLPKNFSEDIYNKLKSDRENATMVSYVEFIDRNLEGLLVNPEYLPAVVCMYNGSYYTPEAYNQMKKALELDSSIVDLKKAKELFNKAKKRKDIAWNYKIDGCYARAHLMARMFEKEGIKVEKAWARGHLLIPGTNNLSWGYHVAPAVLVKQKMAV